ncbi:AsmA family protein [Candidatus Avelusimicrobium gallicola]|uniref:AsmA domain-containing protein n=1 Tax=Candidatus Avelusimicrobium gallicola TaxID=2562704 RepID=A0A1Y4DE72_9BACT|nr:AsmA family protein [Elusimicrobium sp. An273]OUO57424.1 hypothetical protein B5F75_01230 [Elusimicrobium sp. An273]
MKKWLRRAALAAVSALILFFGADLMLRWGSGWDWTRGWTVEKAAALLNREVRLEKMSASFMGVKLDGLEISEAGGFKNGTFLSLDRVRLRADLLYLLRGDFKVRSLTVNGAQIHLERLADGTFNWQSMVTSAPAAAAEKTESFQVPLDITLGQLTVQHLQLDYSDAQTHTRAAAKEVLFMVRHFAFGKPVAVRFRSTLLYEKDGQVFTLPAELKAEVLLKDLNLANASVNITDFSAQYQDAQLQLQLQADSLVQPAVAAKVQLQNLSAQALADLLPQVPPFAISQAEVNTRFRLTPAEQQLAVTDFDFSMPGVQAQFAGNVRYGDKPAYEVDSSFEIDAAQAAALFPPWEKQYRPSGLLKGTGSWNKEGAQAQLALEDGSVQIEHMGKFTGVTLAFSAQENAAFTQGSAKGTFNGKLNGEKFEGKLDVTQQPQQIDADLQLRAGRVALPPMAAAVEPPQTPDGFVADTQLVAAPEEAWPLPPVNIRADIQVASLDAPYVYGTDLVFRSDLTGVTPDLKQTHGDLTLSMGSGEIKDLYRLTNANAVTKVLFLSINIVGKVFNSMNVFAVLDGLGSGLLNVMGAGEPEEEGEADLVVKTVTGPDGQPMQIMVPYTDRKIDGRLAYDKFATSVQFTQGVADVHGGTFVSDMVSFTLDGKTDFNTGELDMTVQAAPGKHEEDGIMPLTVKVGGTVSEPKGSMSLIGSVSSLLTQGINNNFASRSVKKGIGGLFGLFKKKPAPQQTTAVTAAEPETAAQEQAASEQTPETTEAPETPEATD